MHVRGFVSRTVKDIRGMISRRMRWAGNEAVWLRRETHVDFGVEM